MDCNMKNLVIICVFMLYIGSIECCWKPRRCRGGQIYNDCGSPCTPTCDEPNPICAKVCTERCECPQGQVWHNRECIDLDSCPRRCPGGQIYNECGSPCNPTCDEPYPICPAVCTERCECPYGQVWHNSECIDLDRCPMACPLTQEFHRCGSACNATCDDPQPVCTEQCVARCECPYGQVFNASGLCQELHECPGVTRPPCFPDTPLADGDGETIACGFARGDPECPPNSLCSTNPGELGVCCPLPVPELPCDPVTDANGEALFCGQGGVACPADTSCTFDPADAFAVCCPHPIEIFG